MLAVAAYLIWPYTSILLKPHPTSPSCELPSGFVCVNYTLHSTGELDFDLGQGTGHKLRITGFTCTQNYSPDYQYTADINNYAEDPITIPSKGHAFISKVGTSHVVRCTDADGKNVSSTLPVLYTTRIYINYTEVETGISRVAVGDLTARFE